MTLLSGTNGGKLNHLRNWHLLPKNPFFIAFSYPESLSWALFCISHYSPFSLTDSGTDRWSFFGSFVTVIKRSGVCEFDWGPPNDCINIVIITPLGSLLHKSIRFIHVTHKGPLLVCFVTHWGAWLAPEWIPWYHHLGFFITEKRTDNVTPHLSFPLGLVNNPCPLTKCKHPEKISATH